MIPYTVKKFTWQQSIILNLKIISMQSFAKQIYPTYSTVDHSTWSTLFDKNKKIRNRKASLEYLSGLKKLNITGEAIPDLESLDLALKSISGWEIMLVPGIVPEADFFEMLYNKRFPVVNYIRKRESLDYAEEPDIFHDIYAHLPLLTNVNFCGFLTQLSAIAAHSDYDPLVIDYLSRIYWFSNETGLISENGELKIYGAAIISSHKESENVYSRKTQKLPFNVREIISSPFSYDLQQRYFVISSFNELFQCIEDISHEIMLKTGNYVPSLINE